MTAVEAGAAAPKKSKWWLWVLVGCGCLTLVVAVVCGGCMWWGYNVGQSAIKMGEEIKAIAFNNPHVREEVGEIREVLPPVNDTTQQAKDMDNIPMNFQVVGSKGTRTVRAVVSFSFGSGMKLKSARLERPDGTFVDLK